MTIASSGKEDLATDLLNTMIDDISKIKTGDSTNQIFTAIKTKFEELKASTAEDKAEQLARLFIGAAVSVFLNEQLFSGHRYNPYPEYTKFCNHAGIDHDFYTHEQWINRCAEIVIGHLPELFNAELFKIQFKYTDEEQDSRPFFLSLAEKTDSINALISMYRLRPISVPIEANVFYSHRFFSNDNLSFPAELYNTTIKTTMDLLTGYPYHFKGHPIYTEVEKILAILKIESTENQFIASPILRGKMEQIQTLLKTASDKVEKNPLMESGLKRVTLNFLHALADLFKLCLHYLTCKWAEKTTASGRVRTNSIDHAKALMHESLAKLRESLELFVEEIDPDSAIRKVPTLGA